MWQDQEITLKKADKDQLKEKPDQKNLGFGVHFTDHMFMMKWNKENPARSATSSISNLLFKLCSIKFTDEFKARL